MNNIDPNDMVHCPYNKAHKMLRKKLQQHLLKCSEFYKDEVELLVCPFNKAHLIPEPEFFQHTKSCIDRKIVAHYQHSAPAQLDEETRHAKIECEENWDNDDAPDYDPEIYVSSAKVVREAKGLFPSQRKAFIKEERKRLLNDQSDDEDNIKEAAPTASTKKYASSSSTAQRSAPYKVANRHR